MAKQDFIRTPDGSQRIVDTNFKASKAFFLPDYSGITESINDNPNEPGALIYKDGAVEVYDGSAWHAVGGSTNVFGNGLFNDGSGNISWGNTLVSDVSIPLGGKSIVFGDFSDSYFRLTPTVLSVNMVDVSGNISNLGLGYPQSGIQITNTSSQLIGMELDAAVGITFSDQIMSTGAKYAADYSANFTSRSIPDVAWVTSQLGTSFSFGSGLTNDGSGNISLGGTLAAQTDILTNGANWFTVKSSTTTSRITVRDNVWLAQSYTNGSSYQAQLQLDPDNTILSNALQSILINHTAPITITDGLFAKGLVYNTNYSANFTARSLIDKGYADATYATISGSGFVTSVSVALANGITGSSSGGATPILTLSLGAITPSSVNGVSSAIMAFVDPTSSIQTQLNNKLSLSGGTLSGDIQQSASPVNANSLINKAYADNLFTGLSWKQEVRVATTANITLSGTQTVDGIALSVGDRVLVKDQSTQTGNGIYLVASGSWTRTTDADSSAEIGSATVLVKIGTVNKDTQWTCTNSTDPLIGTDNITFGAISGAGTYSNGTGILLSSNVFSFDTSFGDARYLNQNTTGSAAKWTTSRNLAGNAVDGSADVAFANKFIVQGTTDSGLSGAQFMGSLGTGLIKNTTSTGIFSIATAGTDYLIANQTITLSGDITGSGTTSITTVIGAAKVTNSMLVGSIDLTTKVTGVLPNANTTATSALTASTIMGRDANSNTTINNLIEGYTTTATAAGTTTLTVSSTYQQYFTGTTTQTVLLPVTSTLVVGMPYMIVNNSTGVVTVQSSGANAIIAMDGGSVAFLTCISTSGTTGASWSLFYHGPASSTNAGYLTTGTQTINGSKTFTNAITVGGLSSFTGQTSATNFVGSAIRANINSSMLMGNNAMPSNTALTAWVFQPGTTTNSSGLWNNIQIFDTYNQTSTASSVSFLIHRVETALGSGSHKFVSFDVAGTEKFGILNTGKLTLPLILKDYTVSTLPTGVTGMLCYVTDALTPASLATAVGGGSSIVPVFYNGTNWIVI